MPGNAEHAYTPPSTEDAAYLGTGPVPAGPYYRDDYFELEREAIFKRSWLHIGHVCELPSPGSYMVREVEVANASLLITRGKHDVIRAFHNVCPHRGTQLVSESTDGNRASFTCPYHAWTFNTDGSLRAAPDFERFYVAKSQCNLPAVALEICAGLIFINLDKYPAQGLRDSIGELADQLETLPVAKATTFSEYVYEIDANWKLTYDNFQENYHLRFIHPRSGGGAVGPINPFGYPHRYGFHREHRSQTIWTNPSPILSATQRLAFGRLVPKLMEKGLMTSPYGREYYALFPNFFLIGNPVQHFSHTVMPISARISRGVFRIYWAGADASASERFGREFSMANLRDVHSEDRAVIEAGQRGLNSGALEYIHFQQQEVLLRHLMYHVNEKVQAYQAERAGDQ
jgi:phenylpropionate dioxygenase-like ring-hydroxylating dioxygenase large terminal subunit